MESPGFCIVLIHRHFINNSVSEIFLLPTVQILNSSIVLFFLKQKFDSWERQPLQNITYL